MINIDDFLNWIIEQGHFILTDTKDKAILLDDSHPAFPSLRNLWINYNHKNEHKTSISQNIEIERIKTKKRYYKQQLYKKHHDNYYLWKDDENDIYYKITCEDCGEEFDSEFLHLKCPDCNFKI